MPTATDSTVPDIVVAGDVCIDWFAVPVAGLSGTGTAGVRPPNWRLRDGTRMFAHPGGAWLLAALAERATGGSVAHQAIPAPLEHQGCDAAIHSVVDLQPFPLSNSDEDRKKPETFVWRVGKFRGFSGADAEPTHPIPLENDNRNARLVVLDDVGNGFRDATDRWPQALQRQKDGPDILWKLSRPLTGGALAAHLLRHHKTRTIVVLDIDDLRAEGAAISRRLSWEQTAGDVIRALMHDRTFALFREMAHVVVRLDLEGALCLSDLGSNQPKVVLTYMPAGIEGSTRTHIPGDMLGLGATFAAMLVRALAAPGAATLPERLRTGVESGVATATSLLVQGLGPVTVDKAQVRVPADPLSLALAVRLDARTHQLTTVDVAPLAGRDPASRLIDYVRTRPLDVLAEDIVARGISHVIAQAPIAKFGDLETLDRAEIETYRGIRNLMSEYLAQLNPERPLSIAVFGPPGSGKSFGVAQVAKSLGRVEKIDFNVSHFESSADLTGAFHVVRDAAVRGNVPLVFFDEFDVGQRLPWLKHFLAPMQDAKFTDRGSIHLIGRAIFVFAGGTKHTLAEFARLGDPDFIDDKGPDFVSRLRGFVDIRGTDRREPNDNHFVIRRATLLRAMLARKAPALFDVSGTLRIDIGVRRAFLRCGSFVHGARSMESIIDMSLLAGRETFERASLPSEQQLRLHVDPTEFMGLVTQDVRLGEHREELGRAIHEQFRIDQEGKKPKDDPSMQPWDRLAEMYREDNRKQADDIPEKLARIGWSLEPARGQGSHASFSPDEIEELAEDEHERWNDSKRAQDYRYAPPPKDDQAKTHPCLLPWSDLPEVEKDKDRKTVAAIPDFLASIGFRAFKLA